MTRRLTTIGVLLAVIVGLMKLLSDAANERAEIRRQTEMLWRYSATLDENQWRIQTGQAVARPKWEGQ